MELVYLRPLEVDDLERTHRWHNNPRMYRAMGGTFHFVNRTTEAAWLQKKLEPSDDEVDLAICLTETSQHIGNIYLRDIDWIARHAEVHIFIGETDERSRGYGYAANSLLLRHAYDDLGLRRLYVLILDGNISIKLAEKCGYVEEGRMRNHAFIDGEYRDILIMGQCIDDYA